MISPPSELRAKKNRKIEYVYTPKQNENEEDIKFDLKN